MPCRDLPRSRSAWERADRTIYRRAALRKIEADLEDINDVSTAQIEQPKLTSALSGQRNTSLQSRRSRSMTMRKIVPAVAGLAVSACLVFTLIASAGAQAATLTALHAFSGGDGAFPAA